MRKTDLINIFNNTLLLATSGIQYYLNILPCGFGNGCYQGVNACVQVASQSHYLIENDLIANNVLDSPVTRATD